jgi:hypothetical protein
MHCQTKDNGPTRQPRKRPTSVNSSPFKQLNPIPGLTSWFHPFAYKRFHVLLNSLFKVLCNFPSRYLFAIGLAVIFSLRWSLPPALGCTLKQPDSNMPSYALRIRYRYGPSTRFGKSPCQRDLRSIIRVKLPDIHVAPPVNYKLTGLYAGLFPFHSPLLRESRLVSFPPLNYMLKLSG